MLHIQNTKYSLVYVRACFCSPPIRQISYRSFPFRPIFMKNQKNETLPCRPKEHTGDRCTSYRSSRKHSASHDGSHICNQPQQWSSCRAKTLQNVSIINDTEKGEDESWSGSSLVFVIVLVFGEAAELQGVQLLGDFFSPSTVNQLPQLQRSPEDQQQHGNKGKNETNPALMWHSKELLFINSFSPAYIFKLTFW